MRPSAWVTLARSVLTAILILTAAIAVPILWRGFYYAHIDALELVDNTPWSREQVVTAYDQMLDYCIGAADFGTGELRHSDEGAAHFADVRRLFILDLALAAASAGGLLLTLRLREKPVHGLGSAFWGAGGLLAVICVTTALAATDFDRAFELFHALFFPGKSNWLFDPYTDEIIRVLPQEFFRNCALLIAGLIAAACAVLIIGELLKRRKALKR